MKFIRKYKDKLLWYGIDLLLLLAFWGGMLRKSFNCDTLSHMLAEDADILHSIRGGRYITALGNYLLLQIGVRTTTNLSITMSAAFLLLALAMLKMQDIFSGFMPKRAGARGGFSCGLNLVFLNVLFAEPLMFSECSVYFAVAYLSAAAGVKCFTKRKYARMFMLYGIAVCAYQNSVVFAAILTAFYICLDEKMTLSRKAIVREITGVAVCMGMGVLNLFSIYILRHFNIVTSYGMDVVTGGMRTKFKEAIQSYVSLNKDCAGIMPGLWLPLLFILTVWILIIYSGIKTHKRSEISFLFIVWIGNNCLLYVIPMLEKTFFFPPRLSFCFFLIQGLMLVSAYGICEDLLHTVLSIGGVIFLTAHLLFADFTITSHFVSNTLDKVYVNMMYEEVVKYEKETGVPVTKLAVVHDAYTPFSYIGISYVSDQINERALGTVPYTLIEVMTGKKFERVEMTQDVYEQYFEDKDWDSFDPEEQLVIEGDTAYWCIF